MNMSNRSFVLVFFYDLGAQFLTLPSASFASSALRKSLQITIYIRRSVR